MTFVRDLIHSPLLFFLASYVIALLCFRRWKPDALPLGRAALYGALLPACVMVLGPFAPAFGHILYEDGSSILATALSSAHGQSMYHTLADASRYNLYYGPLAYLAYMPPLLVGTDIRLFQLWTILPLAITAVCFWAISKGLSVFGRSLILLAGTSFVLLFAPIEWSIRGDVWILCFAALQIVAALYLEGATAVVALAICGACLVDLKVTTAVLAAVGPALCWDRTRKTLQSAAALLLTVPLALLPFLAKNISLRNHVEWLKHGSNQGLSMHNLELNLLSLAVLLFPVVLFWKRRTQHAPGIVFLLAASAAVAVAVVTGAKHGSGPWHCAPVIPLLLYMLKKYLPDGLREEAPAALYVALMLLAVRHTRGSVVGFQHGSASPAVRSADVAADLRDVVGRNPGMTILMGYGSDRTQELTFQRPLLNALGQPNDLSPTVLSDAILARVPMSPATLEKLRDCNGTLWMLPSNDEPFTVTNYYYEELPTLQKRIVSEDFRQEFLRDFSVTGQSRYFDLWTCRKR